MMSPAYVFLWYSMDNNEYVVREELFEYGSEDYTIERQNFLRVRDEAEKRKAKIVLKHPDGSFLVIRDFSKPKNEGFSHKLISNQ